MTSVLVDGRHLSGYGSTRGFGRYLRSLLFAVAECENLDVSALVTADGAAALPAGVRPVVVSRRLSGRPADLEHRVRLPLDIAWHRSQVFHSAASEPPRWCARPWVQTIHDVPLTFAGADDSQELRTWRRRRKRVPSATAVIAVSRYVAAQATARLGLDAARVRVVPHGVEGIFSPPRDRLPGSGAPGAADPYLLLVGEYGPHKGYREAFAVIDALADRGLPHRLIVAGRLAPWWRPVVDDLLARSTHPERVEFAGVADDVVLVALYRGADALVVTSRAEGFGLPVVEAMACATPVVAFANTALPEVVGDGGVLVPDGDVRAFAEAVDALVTDPARWQEARVRAHRRSRAFSWRACAGAHAEVFAAAARAQRHERSA
jgi:glycosyltransferase involved in cell wall biosynthesis